MYFHNNNFNRSYKLFEINKKKTTKDSFLKTSMF